MTRTSVLRICVDIIILICVLQSWWLVAFAVAIIAAWFFPYFVELIVAGILFDGLFGMVPSMGAWGYLSTIEAVFIFAIINFIRGRVRK